MQAVIILSEKSELPHAITLLLGWKSMDITDDLNPVISNYYK